MAILVRTAVGCDGSVAQTYCKTCLREHSAAITGRPTHTMCRWRGLDYFRDDVHPSPEGAAAIAQLLADLGYEPVSPQS